MSIIRNFIAKGLFKKSGVIANKKSVEFSANALEQRLKNAGVNPNDIKSENELKQILSFVKQAEDAAFDQRYRVIAADTLEGRKITDKLFGRQGEVVDMAGKKIDTSQGIMGGKSVKELMKSGQVQKGTEGLKKSKKITDRDLFKDANQRLRGPVKGKMDMGPFGKVDVERDYSSSINRKEFFDTKAKNMYDKTVKTGPEFFKAQKEQILNTINRKKKEMVPTTHSNYKLLKKSLQDQEDALEAIKVTEDLGGNENMFDFLRTQNIADYKSKPLQRSNYVRNETEQEIADRLNKQNKDSLQNLKNKLDDPEDMADGGVAGLLGERTGFADGTKNKSKKNKKITKRKENMGPPYETNDPKEALKEIVRRMINVEPAKIPLSEDIRLMFDLNRAQIGGQKDIGGGELSFGVNKGFGRDDAGIGFNFKKSFAQGGPARQNFAMGKRAFLKLLGLTGAGIAGLKSGLLGFGSKQATKQVAKEIVTTPAAAGKPAWFDALVTRVVNEGEDVTKKFAIKDRQVVHATKVDDDAMVTVYRDLDDGTVRVDIDDATTNVMGDQGDSVVSLEVRGGQLEEGVKGKTPVEFEAREADYANYLDRGGEDYTTEVIDNVVGDTKDLTADLTKVKMYAKGQKKPTIKEMMIQKDRAKILKQAEENPAAYAADRGPDGPDFPEPDDFASGGIARMLGE